LKASSKSFQKKYNLALVARSIWKREGISRVDISKDIFLDKTSVSNIVSVLLTSGLVEEKSVDAFNSKGGRKPVGLVVKEDFGYVLGLDIQPDKCKIAILDLMGNVVYKDEVLEELELSLEDIVEDAFKKVRLTVYFKKLIACALGMPGSVDYLTGIVKKSDPFKIFRANVGSMFYNKYKLPFFIENDANCGAWSEVFFNKHKNGNFVFLLGELNRSNSFCNYKGGLGFGLGLVMDYKIYGGSDSASGDFKSFHWRNTDPYQFGSEEAKASVKRFSGVLTDEVLEELLLNFTPIISVLNPNRVVVGGDLYRYTNRINTLIMEKFSDRFFSKEISGCEFVESLNGQYDVAIGAASMMLELLFRTPDITETELISDLSWEKIFSRLY